MSRHLTDNRTKADGSRLKPFTAIERNQGEDGTHPASKALLKRSDGATTSRRVAEFVRIARGEEA